MCHNEETAVADTSDRFPIRSHGLCCFTSITLFNPPNLKRWHGWPQISARAPRSGDGGGLLSTCSLSVVEPGDSCHRACSCGASCFWIYLTVQVSTPQSDIQAMPTTPAISSSPTRFQQVSKGIDPPNFSNLLILLIFFLHCPFLQLRLKLTFFFFFLVLQMLHIPLFLCLFFVIIWQIWQLGRASLPALPGRA